MKRFNLLTIATAIGAFSSAAVASFGDYVAPRVFVGMHRLGLLATVSSVPTAADFDSMRVTNSAQSEVIRQRLYDNQLYPAAGVAQLTFFSTPVGQGITTAQGAVVGSAKTQWDTNQELGSQLPSGKQYLIESIECVFKAGSVSTANTFTPAALDTFAAAAAATFMNSVNDVNQFALSGMLEFNVLSKNYLRETPMLAFPPKAELDLSSAVSQTTPTAAQGQALAKMTGRPYYIQPEVCLQPAMNFEVIIKYPAAVALPSGFNARVGIYLDGYLMRASQ